MGRIMKTVRVLLVASEVSPIAKVGGLGDVIGALPKALKKLGVDVRVITGYYGTHNEKLYPTKIVDKISVPWDKGRLPAKIRVTNIPCSKVKVYLVDQPQLVGNGGVYDSRTAMVGSEAELERFLFISKIAVNLPVVIKFKPDIWHLHDWHAAPVTLFLRPPHAPVLLTIHNLENQGWASAAVMAHAGLNHISKGNVNLFQSGLERANFISAVSPTYAKEIQSAPMGAGLEKILRRRRKNLVGILNGIDTAVFDPASDPNIETNFDVRRLDSKSFNSAALRLYGKLARADVPMFGIVSRFTSQKGVDILVEAIRPLIESKLLQFVFLGQGDSRLENLYLALADRYPDFCFGKIGFDAALAQKIYAGSDCFLMPSRFEPCGLGQMKAMRYGVIPIVRATGGLKDTVSDISKKGGNGLVFDDLTVTTLDMSIRRALALYGNRAKLKATRILDMRHDFSWEASARDYLRLYKRLIKC